MTERRSDRKILFLFFGMIAVVLGFYYSEICSVGIKKGIELSVNRLIPSLFPFMVISEIIVDTGACEVLSSSVCRPLAKIFKISNEGALSFLLGMLFGFPIGISSAIGLYRDGKIDRCELLRLSLFISAPSPAFFISAVGEGLFGSLTFGVMIYIISLINAFLIGIASRHFFKKEKGHYFYLRSTAKKEKREDHEKNAFIRAVTSSARALFSISAFVVFFSMIGELIDEIFASFGLGKALSALLYGAFEMTGGVAKAATLGFDGAPIAAAILGFSGISIACQLAYIGSDIKLGGYIIAKLFCAASSFLMCFAALRFFFEENELSGKSVESFVLYRENLLTQAVFALFLCALFISLRGEKSKILKKYLQNFKKSV